MHTDPLAFFITVTTFGTWLPGDDRGWTERGGAWRQSDTTKQDSACLIMREDACILTRRQRLMAEDQVKETCQHRSWALHAVNCRSNHLHVVVSAENTTPKSVRSTIKAWCTRRLKEKSGVDRDHWWTERGRAQFVFTEEELETVVTYINEAQDRKGREQMQG